MDYRIHSLYDLLLRYGPMANQEIAGLLDLSPATVTHIIQPLEFSGLLVEMPSHDYPHDPLPAGDSQHKSRRKTTFRPNRFFASVLVLECSGTMLHLRLVRFDLQPEPGLTRMVELDDPDHVVRACLEAIAALRAHDPHPIVALGLVLPWHSADRRFSGHFPDQLAKAIQAGSSLPVRCLEEASALAMAESFAGNGRQLRDFLVLYVHETIGLGAVRSGQLHDPGQDRTLMLDPAWWMLEPGGPALDGQMAGSAGACLSRAAIDRDLKKLGLAVDGHQTYLVLQRGLADTRNRHPAETAGLRDLVAALARRTALMLGNLAVAWSPERIFLYSPLNELGRVFGTELYGQLEALVPPEARPWLRDLVVQSGDWVSAMTTGAAKAAFDSWLSTLPHTGANPGGS